MVRKDAVDFLLTKPYKFAHLVGFTKMTELHNGWIVDMVRGKEDKTLHMNTLLMNSYEYKIIHCNICNILI